MKKIASEILDRLEEQFPNAKCELNYTTPFELLVAVILSAQCTDKRVNEVTKTLFLKYNSPEDFAGLTVEELGKLIFSCGFYKSKATSIIETSKALLDRFDGKVPKDVESLVTLRGVGRKTANVVRSEAYGVPAIAVDTHVLRTANRLGFTKSNEPNVVEQDLMKYIDEARWSKAHHLLIFLGRYCCSSRNPKCDECMVKNFCKYSERE